MWLGLSSGLAGATIFNAWLGWTGKPQDWTILAWMAVAYSVPLVIIGVSASWTSHVMRGLAVRACVLTGICGSCGYALSGLLTGADGCAVCPECGAAWRLGPRVPPVPTAVPDRMSKTKE